MALAEKGDNLKLDKTIQDVGDEGEANVDKKDDGEDMYGKFLDSEIAPMPVFLWGKAVDKESCKFSKQEACTVVLVIHRSIKI